MTFFKKRWFWIGVGVLVVGGGIYAKQRTTSSGPFYDTQVVQRGTLQQTVEVTGQVVPQARVNLSFPQGGRLTVLSAKVGDKVKTGQVLAETDGRDLAFAAQRARVAVSIAAANLRSREAGETPESIRIAQASVDQAQANYQKTLNDLQNVKSSVVDEYNIAVIAQDTAQKNLDNALASNDQTVNNGYDSLRNILQTSLGSIQTGLVDGDLLIGVDNASESYRYQSVLGIGDTSTIDNAKRLYPLAKTSRGEANATIQALPVSPTVDQVRAAADRTRKALEDTRSYLDSIQRVLGATVPSQTFTASEIAAKKSTIDGDRAAVSTQLTNVITASQTITNAELARTTNLDQLRNALANAKTNVRIADTNRTTKVRSAEIAVDIQKASLSSAQAALDAKKAKPRDVDLAALRAQLADAQTAAVQAESRQHDTQVIASADGVVGDILPKIGEQLAPNAPVISLIVDDRSLIETLVPEADIAKIQVSQSVRVTFDAFGEETKLTGSVVSINPDQTKVQDAVYYKVSILLDQQTEKQVKPGMTANVSVLTADKKDVLFIPSRAIRDQAGNKSVQVLQNNQAVDRSIVIGLRADEGRVEVLSGLQEGEQVIVGELTAAEYKQKQADQKK